MENFVYVARHHCMHVSCDASESENSSFFCFVLLTFSSLHGSSLYSPGCSDGDSGPDSDEEDQSHRSGWHFSPPGATSGALTFWVFGTENFYWIASGVLISSVSDIPRDHILNRFLEPGDGIWAGCVHIHLILRLVDFWATWWINTASQQEVHRFQPWSDHRPHCV